MTDAEDQPSAPLSPGDARRLMRLVDQLGDAVRAVSPSTGEPVGSTAQELLELNRRWQRASGSPLLRVSQAMLLELYSSSSGRMLVTALVVSSHAPSATGFRQVEALKRDGLIDVLSDPEDKRYRWAVLTQAGRDFLRGLLER